LDEIRLYYRVSHTTAYKIRNAFLEGGRAALGGERRSRTSQDLEARVSALEALLGDGAGDHDRRVATRAKARPVESGNGEDLLHARRAGK
jgi:hypothetical protein